MTDLEHEHIRHSPEGGQALQDYLKAVGKKGALDVKTRELLMTALACVQGCPYCTELHIGKARAAGASKEEVGEALLIAALEGAETQLAWWKDIHA